MRRRRTCKAKRMKWRPRFAVGLAFVYCLLALIVTLLLAVGCCTMFDCFVPRRGEDDNKYIVDGCGRKLNSIKVSFLNKRGRVGEDPLLVLVVSSSLFSVYK